MDEDARVRLLFVFWFAERRMLLDFSSLTTEQNSNRMNSTELLDHFWKQVTKKVVPRIQGNGKRTVGVWMADRCVVFASA